MLTNFADFQVSFGRRYTSVAGLFRQLTLPRIVVMQLKQFQLQNSRHKFSCLIN